MDKPREDGESLEGREGSGAFASGLQVHRLKMVPLLFFSFLSPKDRWVEKRGDPIVFTHTQWWKVEKRELHRFVGHVVASCSRSANIPPTPPSTEIQIKAFMPNSAFKIHVHYLNNQVCFFLSPFQGSCNPSPVSHECITVCVPWTVCWVDIGARWKCLHGLAYLPVGGCGELITGLYQLCGHNKLLQDKRKQTEPRCFEGEYCCGHIRRKWCLRVD